jgi:hypothetical protein
MKTIYKYQLSPYTGTHELDTIAGDIVAFQVQHNQLTIWVCGDLWQPITRKLRIAFTGDTTIPDNAIHRGTAQLDGLVWHLFELPPTIKV